MDASLYTRPDKPRVGVVTRRGQVEIPKPGNLPKPLEVHAGTECHVTPPGIAGRMFDYLGANGMATVLEPSAGTGNLIAACVDSVGEVVAIEQQFSLVAAIRARFDGVEVHHADFLEWATSASKYSYILMNPPFKQVKKHMQSAIDLLDDGGSLVALVPITYKHDLANDLEELGPDTFATAKVYTKIIEVLK